MEDSSQSCKWSGGGFCHVLSNVCPRGPNVEGVEVFVWPCWKQLRAGGGSSELHTVPTKVPAQYAVAGPVSTCSSFSWVPRGSPLARRALILGLTTPDEEI